MRSRIHLLLPVAVIAVCLGVAYGSYELAGRSWSAVVDYRSPYLEKPLPPARNGEPVASRTVVVIIDGLTMTGSQSMGTLNALRRGGADLQLLAPQPSLSYPNWTTILSGAPPYISGVVTNWHEGPVLAETIFDTAARAGVKTVFVGPDDFEPLYGVEGKTAASYMQPWSKEYRSGEYVDAAVRLARVAEPSLLVLHLPDIDEAGHDHGTDSAVYASTVARVDADLGRLVDRLQDGATVFAVVADHGHIRGGGHGGWEDAVVRVPAVFAGPGVGLGAGEGALEEFAPTIAALAGLGAPRYALAGPSPLVFREDGIASVGYSADARRALNQAMVEVITAPLGESAGRVTLAGAASESRTVNELAAATAARERYDRRQRALLAAGLAVLAMLAAALIALGSKVALKATAVGVAAYYALYNALFFGVHRYHWSLSAFNSEDRIEAWMNLRLVEAAVAALFAVIVASAVYPLLRSQPKGPKGQYLAGWLSLGPATVLAILSTLGLQVAWFIWWWGYLPEWRLPDLMWGFKYDLDLIQATAVGAVAIVAPVVSYLVGRYHPKTRWNDHGGGPASSTPVPFDLPVPAGAGRAAAEE
jgi:hypothetical protein